MVTYERALELFPGLSREAYDTWQAADAAAEAALAAYEAADAANLEGLRRHLPRAERKLLRAACDAAEEAMSAAQRARDDVTPR